MNKCKKGTMEDTLNIIFRDAFLKDGSKDNTLITKISKTVHWRGPVLIMKAEGRDITSDNHYLDINLRDFPYVVEFFSLY